MGSRAASWMDGWVVDGGVFWWRCHRVVPGDLVVAILRVDGHYPLVSVVCGGLLVLWWSNWLVGQSFLALLR